ncbi:DHA2 family efflux MFS transporter permease subunit [Micromonospora sp. NPDC005161]
MNANTETGHPRRWAALGILALSLVVVTLDNTILNTALPTLASALHAGTADLQWINNAYTLVFAATLIIVGGVGARIGFRRAMAAGMLIFAGGSAAAALSNTPETLIGFRAVMGLGAAFVMSATLAMIIQLFRARERPKAIAIWSAAAGVGVVLGPVTGGLLLDHFAWGSVFWVNLPLIALALTGLLAVVPALPGRRGGRLDLVGAALSAAGLALAVDAITRAPERGWLSGTTAAEAGTGLLLLAAFVGWELRTREPMIDVRDFARRGFAVAAASLGITFFALFGALFVFTQYLQMVHGFSPLKAGLGAMPFALTLAATSAASATISARLGTRYTVAVGLATVALALVALSQATVGTPYPVLATIMGFIGAGMGMIMAPASTITISAVPQQRSAGASSINSVVRELGGVLGIAVIGTIVASNYRDTMRTSTVPGANEDLAEAHQAAGHLPADVAGWLIADANDAFTAAMNTGTMVAAAIAAAGVLAALIWLPSRPAPAPSTPTPSAHPEATRELSTV